MGLTLKGKIFFLMIYHLGDETVNLSGHEKVFESKMVDIFHQQIHTYNCIE